MTAEVAIRAKIFAQPIAVYQALTDPPALTTWFAEHVDCSPADGRFSFWGRYTPFGDLPRQHLLAATTGSALRLWWQVDGVDTTVDINLRLTPAGDTTLTLTQRPVPMWDPERASMADFWCVALGNLANYTEGRSLAPRHNYLVTPGAEARAEIDIDDSSEDVFAALVEPARLDRWIAATAYVEPRVGGRYEFGWADGPMAILELDPPSGLAVSWHDTGWPDTVVRWSVAPAGMHTRVIVRHIGFVGGRPSDGHQVGWQDFLIRLQRMLEIGADWQPFESYAP